MAEKRMVSKVISISKKFNFRLTDHFSRLAYLLLIPHSDDFGRLTGDPFKVKALIFPMMKEVDEETVSDTLKNLHNAELIQWYELAQEQYIQIINFDEHQQGLHKRTKSKFPDPPTDSRKFPEIPSELKGTELNRTRTELNGTEVEVKEIVATDPFISILEEYCNLHKKGDWQVIATDRALIYELLESIKPEFIINTMTSIHKKQTADGKKINGFAYYVEAIKESWKGVTEGETSRSNVRPFRNTGTSNTISDDEFDELLELQRTAMQNL